MRAGSPRSPGCALRARQAGSALLVVLWALFVLTAAIFAWARWIEQGIQMHGNASLTLEARAMAHSGVAVGLHPRITKQSPQLNQQFESDLGYQVRVISEGGKLNLNWLLLGDDPRKQIMLKQWLERRGLNFQQRERFVDCLLDYTDPDNLHRLNGAEDEGEYHAANRPLLSIDEVEVIKGAEPLVSRPGWRDDLTIESSGPIDLLSAPAEILRLIAGLSEARIQRLLQLRAGPDRVEGTADDAVFKDLNQVLLSLGIGPAERGQLNGLVMINDPVAHIISQGHAGKVVRQVEVVARKGNVTPQILSWKE